MRLPARAWDSPDGVGAPSQHQPLDEPPGVIAPDSIAPIKVDQVGYGVGARKRAMLTLAAPAESFALHPAGSDAVAFRGRLAAPILDADSGDSVQVAEFSAFHDPGRFELSVAGAPRSYPFEIGSGVYRRAYVLASRFYYGQRCGTAVNLGGEFAAYRHAACHWDAAFHPSSGRTGSLHNHGGWHDAGDYGRYVVNSGLSTATLLCAWEMFGSRLAGISLELPDSADPSLDRTPDLLREVRWNLDWMLSLQDQDGGVWHKQTSTAFAPFIMPEDDHMVSYVIGAGAAPYKTSGATADLAAVAAIAARVFAAYDPGYARHCLAAATRAWNWLERYPDALFRNPAGVTTGEYGDPDCGDERLWAAAELWRASGDERYHAYFLAHYAAYVSNADRIAPPNWGQVAAMALWSYAVAEPGHGAEAPRPNAAARTAIQQATLRQADAVVARSAMNGYRIPLRSSDYVWGSNSVLGNYGLQLLFAHRFHAEPEYLDAAWECLHYLLGRNALSLSFVTQLGAHSVRRPHHRPSVADGLDAPWPGMLAAGPNRHRNDPAMRKVLPPDLPPAKMYIDNHAAYSCNEVAINWNAPLVFLLAGAIAAA